MMDLDDEEYKATRRLNGLDDKIEVGEYVRTKDGIIDKVDALYGMIENTVHLENQKWFDIKNIVKQSKQLIDLIEEVDYVNGHLVDEVRITSFGNSIFINDYKTELHENDIKTILTKEQFEYNCYKVGGRE